MLRSLIDRRAQRFGMIGAVVVVVVAVVAVVAAATAIWFVWLDDGWSETWFKTTISLGLASGVCAIASLLLLLADHRQRAVRAGLLITLALLALGFLLTLWSIWELLPDDAYETYWRFAGVVWILAALGVVVLPVLSLLLPDRPAPGAAESLLSPDTIERIRASAAASGVAPDEYVRRLLPADPGPPAG